MASVSHRGDGTDLPPTGSVTTALAAIQAELDALEATVAAADAALDIRVDALEAGGGGGGGGTGNSRLINVRDYIAQVVGTDWAPAFAAAIAAAVSQGVKGVFVPAHTTPYTVQKPGSQTPSIDLRGLTDFHLVGEGPGSKIRMSGSGSTSSWFMIHIGSQAGNIVLRDLVFDGDYTHLTSLDSNQQTHLVKIGGSNSNTGGASNVLIYNCEFLDSPGDGVAVAPNTGSFGGTTAVNNLSIANCWFTGNTRSGISNQRAAQYVRIINNHFTGTSDQDIDFEPTGTILDTGPRYYVIIGNTVVHGNATAALTLSGLSGEIPSRLNIFANNHIIGGHVGMVDSSQTLVFGNTISSDIVGGDTEPVLKMTGTCTGNRVSHNTILRPAGSGVGCLLALQSDSRTLVFRAGDMSSSTDIASYYTLVSGVYTITNTALPTGCGPVQLTTGGTLPAGLSLATNYWIINADTAPASTLVKFATSYANAIAGTAVDMTDGGTGTMTITITHYPKAVIIENNHLWTYVAGGVGEDFSVVFTNADQCTFRDNDVRSFSNTTHTAGIKVQTSSGLKLPANDTRITGNNFIGDAGSAGVFTYGVMYEAANQVIASTRTSFNTFRGCTNQIYFNKSGTGSYSAYPQCNGNNGAGTDFVAAGITNVVAIQIGGSEGSQGFYIGNGSPDTVVTAAKCSDFMRRNGSAATLRYVNTDGATAWTAYA